jgi:hypothetical protein
LLDKINTSSIDIYMSGSRLSKCFINTISL